MVRSYEMKNIDQQTVDGFGEEWKKFDQSDLSINEVTDRFNEYFAIFPWDKLPKNPIGFDMGCGSGRWAQIVAPRVSELHCIEPSIAINVAMQKLSNMSNCIFYREGVDTMSIDDESMDFGYSLGVLHHIPNTQAALSQCVKKLKPSSPFLLYIYYNFDNRPAWFRFIYSVSDVCRKVVSKQPFFLRYVISQIVAILIYWPLTRLALFLDKIGFNVSNLPLSYYRKYSFYTMRTDALDRLGTRLEHRYSKKDIFIMMIESGLENIKFSDKAPYWCAVGYKKYNNCC